MSHLKSLAAPKTWPIKRKEKVFITKQTPGPQSLENSMPLNVVLRDMLRVVKTAREAKKILNAGKVLVNNIVRKDSSFPIGIMDSLSIPDISAYYRMIFSRRGKFHLHSISKEDAVLKYLKIINKKTLKGNKTQLNFFDGTNLLAEKDDCKIGDTLVVSGNKVVKHLKFDKGALVYLVSGKHIGETGKLEEIRSFMGSQPDRVILKDKDQKIETLKKYAFVVEKEFENE
ncbi:MAG: 30S ribosomal protein S4e [Nanoarchaeota archaeon]